MARGWYYQFRRGTAAAWVSAAPTLGAGEPGLETDGVLKIGDGSTAFANLDYWPQWVKVVVPYTSLQTAGLTKDVEIYSLPAGGVVHAIRSKVTTAFAGGLIATVTGSFGITGNLTKYLTAATIAGTGYMTGYSTISFEDDSAATSIRLAAISTVANLSSLSAGSMSIWLLISKLP